MADKYNTSAAAGSSIASLVIGGTSVV